MRQDNGQKTQWNLYIKMECKRRRSCSNNMTFDHVLHTLLADFPCSPTLTK